MSPNYIMRSFVVGEEVFCRPTGLPNVTRIDSDKMRNRTDGVYTIVKAWFPDSWRYPMVQFLECEGDNGIAVFASSEVVVVLDDF